MDEKRLQHLTEAFASVISMMLGMLRAHGWRCVLHLPEIWRTARQLRRFGEQFAALMATLMADLKAGRLVIPEPAPWPDPPEQECAYAASPAAPRLAAPRAPASRARPRPAIRPSPPPTYAEPDRPRAAAALPHVRAQAALRPWPSRRASFRFAMPVLPAGTLATGRSC